jgi:IclR family transcriptional regulator, acetate operon repressor
MSSTSVSSPRIKRSAPQTASIQSLDRGLFILEAVAKSADPVALGQLTDLLGIDRSSAFRLANTLRRRGFLANPDGRKDYILGPSIWRLSRKHDWSNVLITFSHEHLRRLAVRTGETTHLALREGRQAFFVDHYHSTRQIIAISGQTGEFVPLHCTAHGKALLADCELSDLKSIFGAAPLQAYTNRTITSIKALARECAISRQQGYVLDDCEYVEGARCLAAPVRDKDGLIIAAIGISAPIARFPRERDAAFAKQVCEAARDLSAVFSADGQ